MSYEHYSTEDLATDEFFQQWVRAPDPETDQFWQKWLAAHPEKQKAAEEAKAIVRNIYFPELRMPEAMSAHIWRNVSEAVNRPDAVPLPLVPEPGNRWRLPVWTRWAAVLTGCLLLSVVYLYLKRPGTPVYVTANGQLRTITLPDSSTVVLNGNSEIRLPGEWDGTHDRVVELDGEAWFSVRHTVNHQKFLVKTPDGVAVEVLGTEFNVSKRKSKTRVVLSSGKVRLHLPQPQLQAKEGVFMKPGELVEFTATDQQFTRRTINPNLYTAWKDHKLILDNTSLEEIIRMLEQTYGLKAEPVRPALLRLKVSGSVPVAGQDSLLQLLSEAYGVNIQRNEATISISQ